MSKFVIFKFNIKRMMKNKFFLILSFVLPLIIILTIVFLFNNKKDMTYIIVNSDNKSISSEYIKEISKEESVEIYSKDKAVDNIKNKIIPEFYEIPSDFSSSIEKGEKPEIIVHRTESSNLKGNFEYNSNSIINSLMIKSRLKNSGIDVKLSDFKNDTSIKITGKNSENDYAKSIRSVLISFISFMSLIIAEELLKLKKDNILSRSFASCNSKQSILGSILLSMFVVFTAAFSLIYLIQSAVRGDLVFKDSIVYLSNFAALVFVALSLGTLVSRLCRNEFSIIIVLQLVCWITCFVGGSFLPYEFLPDTIKTFSKFTPQYWAITSINSGSLLYTLIVVLFGAVLFTAGNVKK